MNLYGKIGGWRLPTKDELNQIYETVNDFVDDGYWTATEYGGITVWSQYFGDGTQRFYNKKDGFKFYVRAVRDILKDN
jgi:hypothetical protein